MSPEVAGAAEAVEAAVSPTSNRSPALGWSQECHRSHHPSLPARGFLQVGELGHCSQACLSCCWCPRSFVSASLQPVCWPWAAISEEMES